MPVTDWDLAQLEAYDPQLPEPADLHAFWATTLAEARAAGWSARFEPVETGLALVDVYDVTFAGFAGDPVKGWLQVPAGAATQLPAVVLYEGYGGGRGLAHTVAPWTLAGYAVLRMDTRGQGSGWTPGDTPDSAGSGPAHPGFMTRGILDPTTYYYRRVFTDAVLAVDVARAHPLVDAGRVAVAGGSQGGGITIAVAALTDGLVAAMPDVPFLCDFPRAARVAVRDPYPEIARYLKIHRLDVDAVFHTLSYFDGAVLGRRATAPALFSVALMDDICPPSTVYAAYHAYGGPKEIRVYPFNDHEGGQMFQEAAALHWAAPYLSESGAGR
jgi:cephalosporin-C deacetylase